MRFGIIISYCMAAGIGAVSALEVSHAQTQEFRGYACVISTTAACSAKGVRIGDCSLFRFLPPNALGNGNNTRLSLFQNTYALNYRYEGSAIGAVFRSAVFSAVGRSGGTFSSGQTWRIPLVQPSNYSLPNIHLLIDVNKFNDYGPADPSLCNIRLRATGQKIPDTIP